jgi:putative ABC transport system ATP-binding protein
MTTALLDLQNASLTLGEGIARVDALIDVNLTVTSGELVAVTGRSGSGKSSLLNVAGGLTALSSGTATVEGEALAGLRPRDLAARRRRSIGYVFQDLNLLPTLTAAENVAFPLELDGVKVAEARAAADVALARLEIADLAGRFPDEMSGGQRQRVAIARGVVGDRRLLLADEPTGALDEVTAENVMKLIRSLCDEGAAALVVTHDPSLAAWADRVVRLRDGRIDSITEAGT